MMHRLSKREEKIRARKRTSQIREMSEGRREGEREGGEEGREGERETRGAHPQSVLHKGSSLLIDTVCLPSLPPSFSSSLPSHLSFPPSFPHSLLDDTSLRAPRRVTMPAAVLSASVCAVRLQLGQGE